MNVTITAVGKPRQVNTPRGTSYSVGIKTKEHGERWLSGFPGDRNFEVGKTYELEVAEKGQYLNYAFPKSSPKSVSPNGNEALQVLKDIRSLLKTLVETQGRVAVTSDELEPDEDVRF